MGDILTFTPRPRPTEPAAQPVLASAELRAHLEEAAQTALDAADRIIAVLDRIDGDTDLEDGHDAEPSLAAPENQGDRQVGAMRGGDDDREAEAPEVELPEVALPEVAVESPPLPWGGAGNVISAAGCAVLAIVVGGA